MAIRSMVHRFAAFMVVLTFSMPSTTLAQHKSVQTEVSKATATQDANAMILEAKAAAEQDASNDINRLAWFSAGLGIAYVGGGVGGIAGCLIGEEIGYSYLNGVVPSGSGFLGFFVGAAAGALLPIIAIYASSGSLPAGRLVGKSPEYVEFYINTYQRKTRLLKTKWAAAGAATGCALPIIGYRVWESW